LAGVVFGVLGRTEEEISAMNELENAVGVSAEQMAAALQEFAEIFNRVEIAVEVSAEKIGWCVRQIAAKLEAQHEAETALRWASVYNRPLYNRHRQTKKLRIRKKYEKRILAWYRAEIARDDDRREHL